VILANDIAALLCCISQTFEHTSSKASEDPPSLFCEVDDVLWKGDSFLMNSMTYVLLLWKRKVLPEVNEQLH
jgi:hypothetical protein